MRERPFLNIAAYTYLFVMLGLLFAPLVSRAETFPASQSSNSVTFSSNPYAGDAAAAGAALAISAGVVYASQPATLRTIAGVVAPLVVRAAPAAGAIGSAVLACFGNPACVVVTAAAAAYVANELAYNYSTDPVTGAPVVTKPDSAVCTVAPCYTYQSSIGGQTSAAFGSAAASQSALLVLFNSTHSPSNFVLQSQTATTFYIFSSSCSCGYYGGTVATSVAPSAPVNNPSSVAELSTAIGAKTDWAADSRITQLLEQIVKNTSQSIPLQIPSVTGPTSIVDTPTVETKADGSKVTTTKTTNFGYYGPTATATETVVKADTTPGGVTTTSSTTTGPASLPAPVINLTVETCGVPGKPACVMSEAGTLPPVASTAYDAKLDAYKDAADTNRDVISGTGDKSFFNGWSVFFSAPAVVQCQAIPLPNYLGQSMGALDPCPVVDGVRYVMGFLWAASALYLCLGMVKGAV
jgi:hypothetical protein